MLTQRVWQCLLLLLIVAASFAELGSYESHLANAIGDDHPAIWAKIYSKSDFNKDAPAYQAAAGFIYSSLPNLLTASVGRFHPQFTHWLCYLFLAIQTLGLVFALFYFCKIFVPNNNTALLTAILTYFIHPWTFNLGYYPNLIFTPYPGQLALPFLVLSFALALKNKWAWYGATLSLAGLIHPTLTLQTTAITFVFCWLAKIQWGKKVLVLGLVSPLIFSLLLPIFFVPQPVIAAARDEILQSIFSNPHLNPSKNQILWPWAIPSVLAIFLLSYLPIHFRFFTAEKKIRALWFSCLISLSGFIIFHLTALQLGFVKGILLSGFRSSSITSLILLPLGVCFLLNNIECRTEKFSPKAIWSYWILGFLIISQRGLPWVGIFALFFLYQFKKSRLVLNSTRTLFFLWWLLFLLSLRPLRELGMQDIASHLQYIIAPAFSFDKIEYLFLFFSSITLFLFPSLAQKQFFGVANACLLSLGLWSCIETGASSQTEFRTDLVEAQKWAQKVSSPNSRFLTTLWSWQGLSEREASMVLGKPSNGSGNPYFSFAPDRTLRTKIQKIFEEIQADNISKLDERGIMKISTVTNTDYFVVDKTKVKARWDFSVCFENAHFQIYDLKHSSCGTI